jgi:hypothetical protein
MMRRRRYVIVGVACLVAAVGLVGPAVARATPRDPQPLRERYEPGETATVVGYTPWRGPLDAYLIAKAIPLGEVESVDRLARPIPVGQLVVEETTHRTRGLRMSLTFTVPADLSPGTYSIATCRRGGACRLGGDRLHVGVDPPAGERTVYHWPLDDPAIADLPDDALLLGYDGDEITAAQVRAGITRQATEQDAVQTDVPDDGSSGAGRPILWLAGGALLVVGWLAITRLGPTRKQVRPKP